MVVNLENVFINEQSVWGLKAVTIMLKINGQLVGILRNDGSGGQTTYEPIGSRGAGLIKEAVRKCGSFDKMVCSGTVNARKYPQDDNRIRHYLSDSTTELWDVKEARKFQEDAEKAMVYGILFGVPGRRYREMQYTQPITTVILEKGVDQFRKDIHNGVLPLLEEGEKILNTNIPLFIVKMLKVPRKKWVRLRHEE